MSHAQAIWCVIIAAMAVVNVPFALSLLQGKSPMPVDARVQASLDEIAASIGALPAKIAADVAAGGVQAVTDATDTATAVQAAADALKAAVGA